MVSAGLGGPTISDVPHPPRFAIHDGYAVYRGPTGGNGPLHRHAAFQIAIAGQGEVVMFDSSGREHRSAVLVVAPMTAHRIAASDDLVTYFVDPHCAFADRLRGRCGAGVSSAPELRRLTERDIEPSGGAASRDLDPRLVDALDLLSTGSRIPDVAATLGLSPQRLRALAKAQLGLPLARWRVWTRLRRAAEGVMAGRSLADAATAAGFSDQAHLTRQMREMMGLTPAAVLPLLRGHPRDAT